jgi:hypothetical protein
MLDPSATHAGYRNNLLLQMCNYLAPFGSIRIHTEALKKQVKSLIAKTIHFGVDLLAHKTHLKMAR